MIVAIIPTAGRVTLSRAILSATRTMGEDDRLVVAVDSHPVNGEGYDMAAARVREIESEISKHGPNVHMLTIDAGHHDWGHSQINAAMDYARKTWPGAWLTFNDDDDVYLPGAFDEIRRAIEGTGKDCPHLFRFVSHFREVIWRTPEMIEGNVGGHCIICPADQRLGLWSPRYEGDYDFVQSTIALHDGRVAWCREIIATARPAI